MKHFVTFALSVFAMAAVASPVNSMLGAEWNEHAIYSQKDLPEGVVQVEYLENIDHDSYILTGIVPETGDIYRGTVGYDGPPTTGYTCWLWGCSDGSLNLGCALDKGSNKLQWRTNVNLTFGVTGQDVLPFQIAPGDSYYNGVHSSTMKIGTVPEGFNIPISLLAWARLSSPKWICEKYVKMGAFSIERDGEIIIDLIAVRADLGNGEEGCFYDLVSGDFFVNAGSGSFLIGPDVEE